MNDLHKAAQQALESLEAFLSDELRPYEAAKTSAALRAALAEPVQEPVAVVGTQVDVWRGCGGRWAPPGEPIKTALMLKDMPVGTMLYTAPPRCPNCASLEAQNSELDRKLAEMEQDAPVQEPVAWRYKPMIGSPWSLSDDGYYVSCKRDKGYIVESLYTAPPHRKPLSLTDLQEALVLTNLIDRDAIEDPEGYDKGSTLAQIDELYRIIIKEQP